MSNYVEIRATVANIEEAEEIAMSLVQNKLAACVQMHAPVYSYYSWKGNVERGKETKLIIKTTREKIQAVTEMVIEKSSYEVPEILVFEICGGNEAYLRWIGDEVKSI